jgi:phosphate-selective porin OprO/OprP
MWTKLNAEQPMARTTDCARNPAGVLLADDAFLKAGIVQSTSERGARDDTDHHTVEKRGWYMTVNMRCADRSTDGFFGGRRDTIFESRASTFSRLRRVPCHIVAWLLIIGGSNFAATAAIPSQPLLPADTQAIHRLPPDDRGPKDMPDSAAGLDDLRRRLEALEKSQAKPSKTETTDQLRKDVSDEKWTIKLGGHVQLDYITWADADPAIVGADNYFNYRRLRLVADGTGFEQFDFRLQMTLEPGLGADESDVASPDVKDAYLSMNEIPVIRRFRIGNFFVPFSLEQVTNDTNNLFNERSIPTQGIFAADREVGIALYNCTRDKSITWTGGLFFDNIDDTLKTRIDNNQGPRLSGRLTWLPYYDELSNGRHLIHTGVGVLYTHDQDDTVRFRARPQVQRGPFLIDTGSLIADSFTTANAELAVVWGPVALQSEAFVSNVNMIPSGAVLAGGGYCHLSYFLTGENRIFERFGQHGAQFGRSRPATRFFVTHGGIGWGGWELKARGSNLTLSDVHRGQYNDLTAGFNWYWSDRTRVMFDWIHPVTSSRTVFGATQSDLIAMRFDFNW